MFTRKILIGVISPYNPKDRKAASGTNYKIIEALENQGAEILWIQSTHTFFWKFLEKVLRRIYNIFSSKTFYFRFTSIGAYLESHTLNKTLLNKCDVIFASFSSPSCYKLDFPKKPIIYLSDATWHQLQNYYFTNNADIVVRDGDKIESYILNKADAIIGSSSWMIDSAINYYQQKRDKMYLVHFGANIDNKDAIYRPFVYNGHLNLLFIGVDWIRKGGEIAVETTVWLNKHGIPSTLNIIGIEKLPKTVSLLDCIKHHGTLNKNIPEQYKLLVEYMSKCHILLLPTKAECSAIVFCESASMGLPTYTHRTGGTADYIVDGYTGRLLEIGATGKDFGIKIKQDLQKGLLVKMSHNAHVRYKEFLNWESWGNKVSEIINNIIN